MSQVERELWEIFTYYTLHGNSLDPFHISVSVPPSIASCPSSVDTD
jgi:hypothetical protein